MNRLDCLSMLVQLADQMQAVANIRDGDALEQLSEAYRKASAQLAALPLAMPDDPDAPRIKALASRILEQQAQLAADIQPWMDDLKLIFREQKTEKTLAAAYRSGS